MHTSSIYTRQRMGIDNNVWISMLTCIVLSAGLLGYNVSNRNKIKPCQPIDFAVSGRKNLDKVTFKTGELLMFRSGVSVKDEVIWDFGDGTAKQTGYDKPHVFSQPGTFTVRALVNDLCLGEKRVVIEQVSTAIIDTAGNVLESIVGNGEAKTNEMVTFNTMLTASSYEWRIDKNSSYPVLKGEEANYTFRTEGIYTVVLTLDNDKQKRYFKTITVSKPEVVANGGAPKPKPLIPPLPKIVDTSTEKPVEPIKPVDPVVTPAYTKLADEGFKTYLQIVVCGNMSAADFNNYLCKGENTPVVINNQEQKTFGQLCGEIRGKKIEIISVVAARDKDKCAVSLNVKYDKKGFLGRKPCKD